MGRLVVIDHGFGITPGTRIFFVRLSPGRESSAARWLAIPGSAARSTGPHVHYEVRVNNAPVNPWRYMKATPAGD